jgi:hypothetical protein
VLGEIEDYGGGSARVFRESACQDSGMDCRAGRDYGFGHGAAEADAAGESDVRQPHTSAESTTPETINDIVAAVSQI